MISTDPIADMLTRIRNGILAEKSSVIVPYSKIKASIAEILKNYGYLAAVETVEENGFKRLMLSFSKDRTAWPEALIRISKPGRRVYTKNQQIPNVRGGKGLVVISTPAGIMTGYEAKKRGLGGEVICKVW